MVKVTVYACDICGRIPAQNYVVETGSRRAVASLCEEHSRELESFMSKYEIRGEGVPLSDVRETASYYEYFATMEEVEQQKQRYLQQHKKSASTKRPKTNGNSHSS